MRAYGARCRQSAHIRYASRYADADMPHVDMMPRRRRFDTLMPLPLRYQKLALLTLLSFNGAMPPGYQPIRYVFRYATLFRLRRRLRLPFSPC